MHKLLTGSLKLEILKIKIKDLPKNLQGLKLVHLSDFHYEGFGLSDNLLGEAIALTNQVEPDIIVLTGDYITQNAKRIYNLIDKLQHLKSRVSIYAVLGNHDIEFPNSQIKVKNALTSIGINVLWNQIVYPFSHGLALVGMAELQSGEFKPESVFNQIPIDIPRIVLSHNPDTALAMRKWRVDLQLSGHTHGSQIIFPVFGPLPILLKKIQNFIPKKMRKRIPYISDYYSVVKQWEWYQGLHTIGNNQLYVNRGLGTFLPFRLCCPPEVTFITLIRK